MSYSPPPPLPKQFAEGEKIGITARLLQPGNIKISSSEFFDMLADMPVFILNDFFHEFLAKTVTVFGKRVIHIDDAVVFFERCEYCGGTSLDKWEFCASCGAQASGRHV